MDCLFCKICSEDIPSKMIYQDNTIVAFHDIAPQAPTHVLIIPRKHIATINDLDQSDTEIVGHMVQRAKEIAKDLGLAESGYRLVFNVNEQGGQAVYHIHLHLLGGRQLGWPPG